MSAASHQVFGGAFTQPKLRDNVRVTLHDDHADFALRSIACRLSFPAEGRSEIRNLVQRLRQGAAVTDLRRELPPLAPDLAKVVADLDAMGMLEESAPGQAEIFCTGPEPISGRTRRPIGLPMLHKADFTGPWRRAQ